MKKSNKKGFTIVELVIVIAVIAILSGVLVAVFTNVIANANRNSAMQSMRGEVTAYLGDHYSELEKNFIVVYEKDGDFYAMAVVKGQSATDYVSKKSDDEGAAIDSLNAELNGNKFNGIEFSNSASGPKMIIVKNTASNRGDVSDGIEGSLDFVKIYDAVIGS